MGDPGDPASSEPWLAHAAEAAALPVTVPGAPADFRRLVALARTLAPPEHRAALDVVQTRYRGPYAARCEARELLRRLVRERGGGAPVGGTRKPARLKVAALVKKRGSRKVAKEEPQAEPAPARVKLEPGGGGGAHGSVAVKREPREGLVGFSRGQEHYCFQISSINSIVPPPWRICFGALGTGIIGVRPAAAAPPAAAAAGSSSSSSSAPAPPPPPAAAAAAENGEAPALPADATIVLLLNAPACPLQSRNGKALGGYTDAIDVERRTMRWSSQRRDRKNKTIGAIVDHCRRGGRIVVVARNGSTRDFKLLGEVDRIDNVSEARFLVAEGDPLIAEKGADFYHKQIGAACLHDGLKKGIGLATARYPLTRGADSAKYCPACCYETAHAVLHFRELCPEGVAAYTRPAGVKREASAEQPGEPEPDAREPPRPVRRLRHKQALPVAGAPVKLELDDFGAPMRPPPAVKLEPQEPPAPPPAPARALAFGRTVDQEEVPAAPAVVIKREPL